MNTFLMLAQQNDANPILGLAMIIGLCLLCGFISKPRKPKGYTVSDRRQIEVTPHK